MEVAQLAAAGLTNEEIGTRVWLSPETVANYVRQICGLLRLSGRSQIAAWVASLPAERPSEGAAAENFDR
jgi:DNA-binding CsgD family transcriptional regulator